MRRALIIGGTGFVGRWLAEALEAGWAVTRTGRAHDVRDPAAMRDLVAKVQPDAVINLAALTTVRETLEDPRAAFATAGDGTANLVAALKAQGFAGRLLQVSSSEVYGQPVGQDLPICEDAPLQPNSPYAFAKLVGEHEALGSGLNPVVARPFTHVGPGQSSRFSVARFAAQIAAIEAGEAEPVLRVGGLAATRDFTDVRDVAQAYALLLEKGEAGGVYNVCSGVETPMQAVLDELLGLSPAKIAVEVDPDLMRAGDDARLRGDASLLSTACGWRPKIGLSRTLSDILEQARNRGRA